MNRQIGDLDDVVLGCVIYDEEKIFDKVSILLWIFLSTN